MRLIHLSAKWATILWTLLMAVCAGLAWLGGSNLEDQASPTGAMATLVMMMVVGVVWVGPALIGLLIAYMTRPQAWATPDPGGPKATKATKAP